jgi:hypothetical protein
MDKVKAKRAHEEEKLVFRGKGKNTNLREGERGVYGSCINILSPGKTCAINK